MPKSVTIAALSVVLSAVIVFAVGTTMPAQAGSRSYCWSLSGCPHTYARRRRHRSHAVRLYRAPNWLADRHSDGDRRPRCLDAYVKIISTEHTSKANAMEAARKMWAAATQWDWGSKFMSLELATDYREWCGQSNAMDTASGRLNEAVSQLAGKEGVNVRCVIRARPCRAALEPLKGE